MDRDFENFRALENSHIASYLKSLLPVEPQITSSKERGHSMSGHVMNPTLM